MILEKGELFEVILFVDLFEEVITNIIMARSKDAGLVTVPKSWCLGALRKRPSKRIYSPSHLSKLINIGEEYLAQLLGSNRGGKLAPVREEASLRILCRTLLPKASMAYPRGFLAHTGARRAHCQNVSTFRISVCMISR